VLAVCSLYGLFIQSVPHNSHTSISRGTFNVKVCLLILYLQIVSNVHMTTGVAMKDNYPIFGVLPSAEDVVIRAAYKALAKRRSSGTPCKLSQREKH